VRLMKEAGVVHYLYVGCMIVAAVIGAFMAAAFVVQIFLSAMF
jgi:hypothetical protein